MKAKVSSGKVKTVIGTILGIGVGYVVGRAFHN
jgi:hypothetical protein